MYVSYSEDNHTKKSWFKYEPVDVFFKQAHEYIKQYAQSRRLSSQELQRFRDIKNLFSIAKHSDNLQQVLLDAVADPFIEKRKHFFCKDRSYLLQAIPSGYPFVLPKTMPAQLSEEAIRDYQQVGVIGPFKSCHPSLIQVIYRHVLAHWQASRTTILSEHAAILALATDQNIIAKIGNILGPNVMLLNAMLHVIPAKGDGLATDIYTHSDINVRSTFDPDAFCEPDNSGYVNVWVSLTATDQKNAPIHFFPGSHMWPIVTPKDILRLIDSNDIDMAYYARVLAKDEILIYGLAGLYMRALIDLTSSHQCRRTEIHTQPGDYLIFHGHTMHGTSLNQTSTPRLAISFRYRDAMLPALKNSNYGLDYQHLKNRYDDHQLKKMCVSTDSQRMNAIQVLGEAHHPSYQPIQMMP